LLTVGSVLLPLHVAHWLSENLLCAAYMCCSCSRPLSLHLPKPVGADASSEGVQRDLLPIIEGSVVTTKHGNVNTDHILFICSGAFHSCKPSDMLAELQGRLPVRVELKGLTCALLFRRSLGLTCTHLTKVSLL